MKQRGLTAGQLKDLADDFLSLGREAVLSIRKNTNKHGVICSSEVFSNGKKG